MATLDAVHAATLGVATALTSAAAAEKVANRGTLNVGPHRFAIESAPQPVRQDKEALLLQDCFKVLLNEAYSEHAHEVRVVLCGYLQDEREQTREQAQPGALCTLDFRYPQCQPGQTITADDAEYDIDVDVNSDGLNR